MALIFRLSEIYFVNKYRNNINVEKYEKDIISICIRNDHVECVSTKESVIFG